MYKEKWDDISVAYNKVFNRKHTLQENELTKAVHGALGYLDAYRWDQKVYEFIFVELDIGSHVSEPDTIAYELRYRVREADGGESKGNESKSLMYETLDLFVSIMNNDDVVVTDVTRQTSVHEEIDAIDYEISFEKKLI